MQKKKLSLDKIEIQSFITQLNSEERKTFEGGVDTSGFFCSWYLSGCVLTLNCNTMQLDTTCKSRVKIVQLCNDTSTKMELSKGLAETCPFEQ